MAEEVRRLSAFPRNDLLEEPAITGKASELELLERLGPPTATRGDASFDDPRQFWDLVWPCGLVTAIEYHQLTEEIVMYLDAPDVDHALRHLGVDLRLMEQSFDQKRDRFDRLSPRPDGGLWSVVAEGVDVGRVFVARNLTERDAMCRRNELAATDSSRIYRLDQSPG